MVQGKYAPGVRRAAEPLLPLSVRLPLLPAADRRGSCAHTGRKTRPHRRRLAFLGLTLVLAASPLAVLATPMPHRAKHLTLIYDAAPAACHYLLNLYNRDLARQGYVNANAHKVFQAIHWAPLPGAAPSRFSKYVPGPVGVIVMVASFDINNDGKPEPVARALGYVYRGPHAVGWESLAVLDRMPKDFTQYARWTGIAPVQAHILTQFPPALGHSLPVFMLKHLKADPKALKSLPWPYSLGALPESMLGISPFVYQNTVYLSISRYVDQDVRYPDRDEIFTDGKKGPSAPWVVIGKFLPDNTFHDVCYLKATAK